MIRTRYARCMPVMFSARYSAPSAVMAVLALILRKTKRPQRSLRCTTLRAWLIGIWTVANGGDAIEWKRCGTFVRKREKISLIGPCTIHIRHGTQSQFREF